MARDLALCVISVLFLNSTTAATAQTRDPRVDDLKKETAQLRTVIAAQGTAIAAQERRITDLEKAVKALQTAANPAPTPIPAPTPPWQTPANWNLIKKGMSEAQVVEILGPPTSVDTSIDVRTLLYQSDSRAATQLKGSVTLQDDRVTASSPPLF